MGQRLLDAKSSESWKVFRAFLSSLPPSESAVLPYWRRWRYLTGNREPDFVWPEGKIAVELTGWVDQTQMQKGKALEKYNQKVSVLLRERRANFKGLDSHWVYLEAFQQPSRKWNSAICTMLAFFAERANALREPRMHVESSELPREIRGMFRGATIYKMPDQRPLVRAVAHGRFRAEQSVSTEDAIEEDLKRSFESLKRNLRKKIEKAGKYRIIGEPRDFKLWLVIHYDDAALEWAAPLLVLAVQFSYGPDARESQKQLAQRARREVYGDLQRACFDRVYLLFADAVPPHAEKLWP